MDAITMSMILVQVSVNWSKTQKRQTHIKYNENTK